MSTNIILTEEISDCPRMIAKKKEELGSRARFQVIQKYFPSEVKFYCSDQTGG